jgi:hypothetical protein
MGTPTGPKQSYLHPQFLLPSSSLDGHGLESGSSLGTTTSESEGAFPHLLLVSALVRTPCFFLYHALCYFLFAGTFSTRPPPRKYVASSHLRRGPSSRSSGRRPELDAWGLALLLAFPSVDILPAKNDPTNWPQRPLFVPVSSRVPDQPLEPDAQPVRGWTRHAAGGVRDRWRKLLRI